MTPCPCPRNEVLISGIFQGEEDVILALKRKQLSSEYHLVMWKVPGMNLFLLHIDMIGLIREINVFPMQLC